MDVRVAVLEQIAKNTEHLLAKIDARLDRMEDRQVSDFKWLLGLGIGATAALLAGTIGLLATMAHGFHWI